MADQPLTAREFEDILRRMNESGGGGRGMGRGVANEADRLEKSLEETASSLQNYLSVQKEYTKRHQAGSFIAGLFNKSTEMASRNMGQLRSAIAQHERALDALTEQGHSATSAQYKKVQADLKVLQGQEQMYQAQSTGAEIIRNASGQVFQTFLRLGTIQAEYQANLLNIVAQGGSGFQMAAAAMENAVNQMHAMQTTMAQIAQSAGQSLGQLGGKFAPLAGMALNALGHAAQAAADAARTLAMAQIRIMAQEGDKLIKTHHELTNAGVIYGNGMKGLINATHGTKLRLEEMSAVVARSRESFADVGIGMSDATDLIGGVVRRFASTTGQFAKMDRQLLALGFSYQEQAELAAETAAQMALGGKQVNQKEVAQATIDMAKSMRLVAEVAGEDMKERRKKMQAEQQEFFIKGQLAKMQRDDPERYKRFQLQLQGMTDQQRKAAYQMQFYGTVVDKNLAIQMATNSGFNKIVKENDKALKDGSASTEQALATRKKYAKEEMDGAIRLSGTIGKASNAVGAYTEVSQAMSESMTGTQRVMNADINKASRSIQTQMDKAGKPDASDPTSLLLTAVEKGAIAAKNLQEEVIKRLPRLASALEQAYKDAMATLRGEGGGGGIKDPTGILAWLQKHLPEVTAAVTALTLGVQMFGHKIPGIFQNIKDKIFKPKGLPGSGGIVPEAATPDIEAPGRESRAERRRRERTERRSPGGRSRLPLTSSLPSTVTPGGGGAGGGGLAGMLGELAEGLTKFGPALKSIGVGIGDALAGFLRGIAGGISAFANPMVIAGSIGFGVAIAAVGAGIAGAAWITGKALPTLANGLLSFNEIDGRALIDVGLGVASLGAGLLVFGAGSAIGGAGNVIGSIADGLGSLFGGKDIVTKLKEFSTLGPGLGKTGESLTTLAGAMVKFQTSLVSFTKIDIKPLDTIIDKLNKLKEAAKPPQVSVIDATKNMVATVMDKVSSTVGTPTTAQPGKTAPTRVALGSLPTKQGLTAAEKAAAMETVAVNTKYTNDLLIASQKNVENLQKLMLQRLEAIVSATEATAGFGKKTARNTS